MTDEKNKLLLAILACALIPAAIYANTLNAPFIFDDFDNIVHNADIQNPAQLFQKFKMAFSGGLDKLYFERAYLSRPLTFTSFALSHRISGLNPYGYHLLNIFFHAASTLLLFLLTRKILIRFFQVFNFGWSLAAAALFAAHPIHTDVVAFVSNRSDAMATCFYLLALLLFIRMADHGEEVLHSRLYGVLSLLSFTAAFGFKEIAATFPLMVLLFDLFFISGFRRRELLKHAVYHCAAWSILLLYVCLRMWYSRGVGYMFPLTFGWTHENYFFTQIWVVGNYAKLLFWPAGQSIDHWIHPLQSLAEPKVYLSALALTAGAAAPLWLIRRSRWFRLGLFGALWFFIALAPTSSFFPINDAFVERRAYLPSIGFFLWLLSAALWLNEEKKWEERKIFRFAFGIAILLAGLTIERNRLYADPLKLWLESAERYPDNYRAQFNCANIYFGRDGNLAKAQEHCAKALALNPDLYDANRIMGITLVNEGKFEEAIRYYNEADRLRPQYPEILFNRGLAYMHLRKDKEAVADFKAAASNPASEPDLRDGAEALIEKLSGK